MQHKALFAAMLVGAVTLASCVKSIESQSVTDVRKAHAEEILSQAELNKANAQAAVTLANAEATLKAAEAELAKANAQIAQAEAKKLEAEAELLKIEAQLQTVRVEQEKVELQIKQAELQKALAEAEAAIAEAELTKQRIANELELMAQELEIAKSQNAMALLQAQTELENYIKAKDEAEREALQEIAEKYIAASEELIDLQMQYNQYQTYIAMIEAAIKAPEEVWAEEIAEKRAELARVEMKIAAIQKYAKVSPEEVEAYLDAARLALMEAENIYQDALKDQNAKFEALNAIKEVQTEYTNDWYTKFQGFVMANGRYTWSYNEEKDIFEYGILDENDEFVALWYNSVTKYNSITYPEPKDGIMPSAYTTIREYTLIPAKVNSANFDVLFKQLTDDKEAEVAAYTETVEENLATRKENLENQIKDIEDRLAAYQEYVDAVEPKVNAAEALVEEKEAALEEAKKAEESARKAYDNYWNGQGSEVYGDWYQAQKEYNEAEAAKDEADNAVDTAEDDLNGAKSLVETWTNNKYYADLAVATNTNEVNVKKKAVTDEIVKAVSDAEAALAKQQEVVEKAKKAVDDAETALRAANIKLAADPTNEELIAAQAAAENKKKEAGDKYNEENGKLPALQTAVNNAQADFDAVNDPYQTALENLESAKEWAATCKEKLEAAKKDVEEAEAALTAAKQVAEEAAAAKEAAATTYEAAEEIRKNTNKESNALWKAYWEDARNAVAEAQDALNKANSDLLALKNNYSNYDFYLSQLDPEVEYSDARSLNDLKDQLENADINAAEDIANKEAELTALQEEIGEVKANLKKLDEVEPAYTKVVDSRNEADKAYVEARKVTFDAMVARDQAKAEVEGMASTYYYWDEDGNLQEADVYTALAALNEQKADIEAEIDSYITEWPEEGKEAIEALQLECSKLALRIEVLSKIVAEYEALLQEAFGTPAA